MAIRALLFDFDGLLIDTEMAGYHAWSAIFAEFELALAFDRWCDYVLAHGAHEDLAGHIDGAVGAQDWDALHARRRLHRNSLATPMEGALEAIERARFLGLRTAIVSNSPYAWVTERMATAGLPQDGFDVVITRDNGLAPKPAPDSYLAALDRLDVSANEAIVFEDAPRGVQAAHAAGIYCVAIPGPVTERGDFTLASLRLASLAAVQLTEIVEAAEAQTTT